MSDRTDRTRLIASATRRGRGRRAVAPPIERASTLLNDSPDAMRDESRGPVYGIEDLSAARELRALLAELEGAIDAWLVPSGLAAVTAPLTALLRPGDAVLTTDALYGPSRRFLKRHMGARGVTTAFHAPDAATDDILAALTDRTRVLLIESPGSLTFDMLDIPALAAGCRARGVLTVMDNTWGAGLAFRPLAWGVDVSVQAVTKYVAGHSDLLMGSIAVADPAVGRPIAETLEDLGWRVSPDDAWLALRGLRTLPLRYAEQARSALVVAEWLRARPEVADILYPALPGSTGHDLWKRDYAGAASIFGVVMQGGDEAAAHALMAALELFGLGYSWGGFESLITHETGQLAGRKAPPELAGQLLRLHVGLEEPADLIADLEVGLAAWRAQQDSNLQPSA
ncbi:MAG: cystathionine beta-lyase [Brevundimonas sp.]|uniref:cystathionine beta-lyase n=1 Tax=Brevundimonas sp. TaxID=1871086 RepID=UPI0027340C0F|nr:cystathionine beta-lyase [Brevundimonas sp.]MDP3371065.1 cystathionine beta-lyase [Brevundimonas sp.]MDP3656545.1 cystathionine beta-lyase [Brevundimonas sp.]MDZ4109114.1 cystathionine beta-lyase [Brevundimonas sp.]